MDCVKLHSHHHLPLPSQYHSLPSSYDKKKKISLALINWSILSFTDPFTTSAFDDLQWLVKQISFSLFWHLHNHKLSSIALSLTFPLIKCPMCNSAVEHLFQSHEICSAHCFGLIYYVLEVGWGVVSLFTRHRKSQCLVVILLTEIERKGEI